MQKRPSRFFDSHYLLIKIGRKHCALPLHPVMEIMRPLPLETWHHVDPVVLGVARVRSCTVPVISLKQALGGGVEENASVPHRGRWVLMRWEKGVAVLAVDEVLEVCPREQLRLEELPSLLADMEAGVMTWIGRRDQTLLTILDTALLLPDSVWNLQEEGIHRDPEILR